MAYRIKLDYASRGGSSEKKKRTYRQGYVISGTGAGATALQIRAAVGIFPYQTRWPDDPGAICISTSEEQEEDSVWRSDIKFSTITEDPDENAEDPLRRPPKRAWSSVEYDEFPHEDINGIAVVNSAGQLYTEFAIPEAYGVLTIRRNEAVFGYEEAIKYSNKLNSKKFYGAGDEHVLCKPIAASEEHENDIDFAAVSYTFHFGDPDKEFPFAATLIDAGRYYLTNPFDEPDGVRKKALPEDTDETKFSDTVALDGRGGLLLQADVDAGNFKLNVFQKHKTKNFGPLNLEW